MDSSSQPNRVDNSLARPTLLVLLLWLSGFCGISYEILYARLLGNLLGDQFGVSAAVLLTFLLGIGLGTLFAHRLMRWLWAIELGVGLCGVAFALFVNPIGQFLYAHVPLNFTGLSGAMLISSLLLLVPTFLIGTTLPLFAAYLNRAYGKAMFANTYLVYNFGAALTALGIEFVLVREFGLKMATVIIASLNFIVGASVYYLFKNIWGKSKAIIKSSLKANWPKGRLVTGLILASVASAIFQLTMIKVAEGFLGPFRETFALVLTITLLGIAAGSVIVNLWRPSFCKVLGIAIFGLGWLFVQQVPLLEDYSRDYLFASQSFWGLLWFKLKSLAWLMGPAAIGFGATIPALLTDESDVSRDSGRLLFISSISNAVGFLLMAFFLHERFEYGKTLMIVTIITIVAAIAGNRYKRYALIPPMAGLLILVLPARQWQESMLYLGYHNFHKPEDLTEARQELEETEIFKGKQDNFAIVHADGRPYLMINGYRSIVLDRWYEKGVGAITSTFAPRLDKALVLGLGGGATASTVGLAFDRTDVVEINPVLIQNQHRFSEYNFDITNNERVNIIQDDGIHYIRSSKEKYSLILNTVTTPLYFSSSKLYTVDFLSDVRNRMTPDGIYMTWLDSRISDQGIDIMLKTISEVFPYCRLAYVRSGYFLLIASTKEPARPWHPDACMRSKKLRDYFFHGHDLNPAWMPYSVIFANAYDLIHDTDAPLNTLDRPTLEFIIASLGEKGYSNFRTRLKTDLNPKELESLNTPSFTWKANQFIDHARAMLPSDNWLTENIHAKARQLIPDFENSMDLARADFFAQRATQDASAKDHYWASVWYRRGQDYDLAIAEGQKALAISPEYNNAWYVVGQCYEKKGDLDAAINAFLRELKVDPKDEDVPPQLGKLFHKKSQYPEAIHWLTQALEKGDNVELLLLRGEALLRTGKKSEALNDFKKVLSSSSQNKEALELLMSTID